MTTAAMIIAELRARGQLWQPAPGVTVLRGDVLRLQHMLTRELAQIASTEAAEEWSVPPVLPLQTLARADYFVSFPQWLTLAGQLSQDNAVLADIAASVDPAASAADAAEPTCCALQPAVCYHVYAGLSHSVLHNGRCVAIAGTCWRREQTYAPLEREWAFTMRETVFAGPTAEAEAFRQRGIGRALALAQRLGMAAEVVTASDPFFAPSTRGRALVQRIKALKHELLLPLGEGRTVAAASFNNHERFFGEAFDIRLVDGTAAGTACVAYGVERWMLAFLVAHGVDSAGWPASDRESTLRKAVA